MKNTHMWKSVKRVGLLLLGALALILAPLSVAWAADAVNPEDLASMFKLLVSSFQNGQWALLVSLVLMIGIRLLRAIPPIARKLPSSVLPWLSAGLGLFGAVATNLLGGQSIGRAILGGLTVGAAASGLWSLVGKHLDRLVSKKSEVPEKPEA